ncbi:hypothetical protein ACFQ9Y_08220 [Peribacillus simplex]|uniref:hypothetical protein n=1 Tax=Peribacillus simplex TaxID=1478 RepID=UPI00366B86DF
MAGLRNGSLRGKHSDRFLYRHGQGWWEYDSAYRVVSHIVGQRRYMVKIIGESVHAGTTLISYRKDAVGFASEFILF